MSCRGTEGKLEDLFRNLGDFIARNAFWAGPILGLTTFGESMVVIGAFFPATLLMGIAGGLVAAGVLSPWPVLFFCILGAVLGDAVSYWLGRKLGPKAWNMRILKKHRRVVARARLFFRHFGVLAIYLCRFMGPVRAFVPLICGMTSMAHRKFQIANVGSAAIWVPVMLAVGYLPAKGVQILGEYGGRHAIEIGIAIMVVVGIAVFWGWRRLSRRIAPELAE
jgi:membrane protein DedA with SNARE-associated domain